MTGKTSTERSRKSKKRRAENAEPESDFGPYPGYWTELMIIHNFPPNWEPASEWGLSTVAVSAAATRGRETQVARGYDGSIAGISRLSDGMIAQYRERNRV